MIPLTGVALGVVLLACQAEPDVRKLLERLASDSVEERGEAVRELKKTGKPAVPALEAAARSADAELRSRASRVLLSIATIERLSPTLLKAAPGLEDRLGRPADWTREFLELAGVADADLDLLSGPALAAAEGSQKLQVIGHVRNHGCLGGVPGLILLLKSGDTTTREEVALSLSILAQDFESRNRHFGHDASADAESAVRALRRMKPRKPVAELRRLLIHDDATIRWIAVSGLEGLGLTELRTEVRERLTDQEPDVRVAAVKTLGAEIGNDVVPALLARLKDESSRVRLAALKTLVEYRTSETLPTLSDLFQDALPEIRQEAIHAVQALNARDLLPKVVTMLEDPKAEVSSAAVQVLIAMDPRSLGPKLVEYLKDPRADVRARALYTLYETGIRDAVPELDRLLKDPEENVRYSARVALGKYRLNDRTDVLVAGLKDPDVWIRMVSATSLAWIGVRDKVPDLLPLLKDRDPNVREAAVEALGFLGARAQEKEISTLLKDESYVVRCKAIEALARLGCKERKGDLIALMDDPYCKIEAAEALCRLGFPDGLPTIVKAEVGWNALNWRRAPETAKKLGELRLDQDLVGPRKSVLEGIGRRAGIRIDWPTTAPRELQEWGASFVSTGNIAGDRSLWDALANFFLKAHAYFILEADSIRVLPAREGFDFWKAWGEKLK